MKYRNLIFLHIPKAAGTTLHPVLERHYPAEGILSVYDPEQAANVIPQWPVQRRETIRLLKGHVAFGLHRYLVGDTAYITLLRDPVDRIVSHYFYVRRYPTHYLHKTVMDCNMSLADYGSSRLSDELDNGQVRLLAGVVNTDSVALGACGQPLLDLAKRNIEGHFPVAGLTERFDESLALMAIELGWNWVPSYTSLNVSDNRPPAATIDAATRARIEQANPLDCELYQWARQRFESQIERHRDRAADLVQQIHKANQLLNTGT